MRLAELPLVIVTIIRRALGQGLDRAARIIMSTPPPPATRPQATPAALVTALVTVPLQGDQPPYRATSACMSLTIVWRDTSSRSGWNLRATQPSSIMRDTLKGVASI